MEPLNYSQVGNGCSNQCEDMFDIPPVTTYHKVLITSGHYRRVIKVAYGAKVRGGIAVDTSHLGRLKGLLDEEDLDNIFALEEKPMNCAFVSPLMTLGLDILKNQGCGCAINNQTCCGNAVVDSASQNKMIKMLEKLQEEIEKRSQQINSLTQELGELSSKNLLKDEDIRRCQELQNDLERQLQEAIQEAQRQAELAAEAAKNVVIQPELQAIADHAEHEPLDPIKNFDLTTLSEDLTPEKIKEIYDEYKEIKERMEKIQENATQSIKTYYNATRSRVLSHGVEAKMILEKVAKEIRLRIDYQLKTLMIARSSRTRLLAVSEIDCVFSDGVHFEKLRDAGLITDFQLKNFEKRVILFGFAVPCIIEFKTKDLRNIFCQQIDLILDSVGAEQGTVSTLERQPPQRRLIAAPRRPPSQRSPVL